MHARMAFRFLDVRYRKRVKSNPKFWMRVRLWITNQFPKPFGSTTWGRDQTDQTWWALSPKYRPRPLQSNFSSKIRTVFTTANLQFPKYSLESHLKFCACEKRQKWFLRNTFEPHYQKHVAFMLDTIWIESSIVVVHFLCRVNQPHFIQTYWLLFVNLALESENRYIQIRKIDCGCTTPKQTNEDLHGHFSSKAQKWNDESNCREICRINTNIRKIWKATVVGASEKL